MGDDSAGVVADERAESERGVEEAGVGGAGDQDWEDADSSDGETVRHASNFQRSTGSYRRHVLLH